MRLGLPLENIVLKKYPQGNIFQGFGENPADYLAINPPYNGHPGWDLVIASKDFLGSPWIAVCDGVIRDVQDNPAQLGGRSLRLVSDEVEETHGTRVMVGYSHGDTIFVSNGQHVKKGDIIGTVGNSGFIISGGTKYWGNAPSGKGVHLHFGICQVNVLGDTPNIIGSDNGFRGWVDPTSFYTDSIKSEIPDPRIPFALKVVELLRSIITKLGGIPKV